jgi:hypothetical protein
MQRECGVRLRKLFGRIGFLAGFMGPIVFYLIHYEAFIFCPLCPHVDVAFGHPLLWLQIGLTLGLTQGLIFALHGFAIGYSITKIRTST